MVLDFGILNSKDATQTANYRTAGSHQSENLNYELITDANQWEEIHTVTTGKTYYISGIVLSSPSNDIVCQFGSGAPASETNFMVVRMLSNTFTLSFSTPIKMASGTRIAGRTNAADDVHYTLIGWEE